ncbi:MAG: glycosyltransferase family 2 protein [Lentisphaeria bacterium]|nr:glycosyltransferase family 2 protein [Lentisphaeria bacterium]
MTFTIATATYNRANVLYRVYESLSAQTFLDFEWIIVDDGSTDNTRQVVACWQAEAAFPIFYYYQENSGKHMALNFAVEKAEGELFVIADSDDSFRPDSLEVLLKHWNGIVPEERQYFRGVTCRCYDPETGKEIGTTFPEGVHDVLGIEATFQYHYTFEMWGFNRTAVMKEFPFPNTAGEKLAFYPESVIWNRMGMKYKVRFVDDTLRAYYRDQGNATMHKKRNRSKENIHLWMHYVNELGKYFWCDPMRFLKAYVGLVMDGLLLGRKAGQILIIPKTAWGKIMTMLAFPVGFLLYLRRK